MQAFGIALDRLSVKMAEWQQWATQSWKSAHKFRAINFKQTCPIISRPSIPQSAIYSVCWKLAYWWPLRLYCKEVLAWNSRWRNVVEHVWCASRSSAWRSSFPWRTGFWTGKTKASLVWKGHISASWNLMNLVKCPDSGEQVLRAVCIRLWIRAFDAAEGSAGDYLIWPIIIRVWIWERSFLIAHNRQL